MSRLNENIAAYPGEMQEGMEEYDRRMFSGTEGMGQDETAQPPVVMQEPNIIDKVSAAVTTVVPGGWWGLIALGVLGYWGWNKARDEGWF